MSRFSQIEAFKALQHRNFRVVFFAATLSNTGSWAQRVAQDWLVLELTNNSAQSLGIVTGLQFLPSLFFSLYGGALADRFNKRKLLMLTNAGAGLTSLTLGLLVIAHLVRIEHVYLLALVLGLCNAIDAPIRQSFTSELVGKSDVANAVSLNSANFNAGRLVGPGLSGFLISLFGTGPSFIVNAISEAVVILALTQVREQELHRDSQRDRAGSIKEALHHVRERLDLLCVMITVFFAATFGLNFQVFNALMATTVYGKGPREFGGLGSILAIGSLTGALLSTRYRRERTPQFVTVAAMVFGLGVAGLSFTTSYLMYSVCLPISGALALTTMIAANTYVQTKSNPMYRGRVLGLYLTVFLGGTPLGSPAIGWLSEHFGIRHTMQFCGLVTFSASFMIYLVLRMKFRTPVHSGLSTTALSEPKDL